MKKTDSQLQHDVMAELEWEPSVDHANIGVSVYDGIVTLSGFVRSFLEKLSAEAAASRVAGVKGIAQELQVRLATDAKIADHEIAKRILDTIDWHVALPDGAIMVKVEHGRVILSGLVDWPFQSDEACKLASRIDGITGITNLIVVKQHPRARRACGASSSRDCLNAQNSDMRKELSAVCSWIAQPFQPEQCFAASDRMIKSAASHASSLISEAPFYGREAVI